METALAGGEWAGRGGGHGAGRRGRNVGRNPKNILTVLAGDTSLAIPEAFRELVRSLPGVLLAYNQWGIRNRKEKFDYGKD